MTVEMLGNITLPLEVKRQLVKSANQSLATNSNQTYATGLASYIKSCKKWGTNPTFPPSMEQQLTWQADMSAANLSAGTMRCYWAAVARVCQMMTGTKLERHLVVDMSIRGAANTVARRKKVVMTYPVLRELKASLDRQPVKKMTAEVKAMVWAVAATAMCGSFRLGELLPTRGKDGRLSGGLLKKDLRRMATRIQGTGTSVAFYSAKVRQPKERKNGEEPSLEVELFSSGGFFCPVSAIDRYMKTRPEEGREGNWTFLFPNGSPITKSQFNKILRKLLKHIDGYQDVAGHSFRRGVPSLMARAGYSDEMIARQGRWRSNAFELYTCTGRGSRLEEQHALHATLSRMAEEEAERTGSLITIGGEQ